MKIAVFVNTPAQLHFYRNIVSSLIKRGHEVIVLVRDARINLELLEEFKFEERTLVRLADGRSKIGKVLKGASRIMKSCRSLRSFRPDVILGMGVYDAITSAVLGSKCIEFEDSEPSINTLTYALQFRLYLPFVDAIITPSAFRDNLGERHIRVNSFKELAYLHPNYFKPEKGIYELLGIEEGEEYAVLRFNAFGALHDVGIRGFSNEDKIRLVKELEEYVHVFISSEAGVPDEIKSRVMRIPKSRIHDALYYAKLLVADTGTMVTEAACLGTPAIMLHPAVKRFSNFTELEQKYGLIWGFDKSSESAIKKALEVIKNPKVKDEWNKKREKLLAEKIDIAKFMVWFIENYPESFEISKKNEITQRMPG
jgi:predicted glycosyltransferase